MDATSFSFTTGGPLSDSARGRVQAALAASQAPTDPRTSEAGTDPEAAAKRFESLLATMLVKELRQSLPEGFFGGGSGADVYAGWLDTHLGDALAGSDALGIAGMVKAELGRIDASREAEAQGGTP